MLGGWASRISAKSVFNKFNSANIGILSEVIYFESKLFCDQADAL